MRHTPSYVLGDTAAAKFGQPPRGVPDMDGYAVGLHIVDAPPGRFGPDSCGEHGTAEPADPRQRQSPP
ncbi:hypothetical protein [Allorhizocola rhizosphaerae]|uniref:hypothetical protein n=1 Tax=Allorhizocola rhizosphaerae TaxID=1872709 RepID=UPI000E3C8E8B|nr:hypothetical protein [Allorhizocola rhizosphaerae]